MNKPHNNYQLRINNIRSHESFEWNSPKKIMIYFCILSIKEKKKKKRCSQNVEWKIKKWVVLVLLIISVVLLSLLQFFFLFSLYFGDLHSISVLFTINYELIFYFFFFFLRVFSIYIAMPHWRLNFVYE